MVMNNEHNEHLIKLQQLTDLLYVVQLTLTDIRTDRLITKI